MNELKKKVEKCEATICIIGLGYVGLQLAVEFAFKGFKVRGFDINRQKINLLIRGIDYTSEVGNNKLKEVLNNSDIIFTDDEGIIREADIIIICVPTPVTKNFQPDLRLLKSVSKTIGRNLKKEVIVVLESTVYPGVTEEFMVPIIERTSGMKYKSEFWVGYSPERINPGDKEHTLKTITKVVSGDTKETTEILLKLYGKILDSNIFVAKNIKTAEAAKVIENIQRDLNIALMNELSIIFRKMGIKTKDVLEAAFTKWNFGKYYPGLVGGHCIPVDPYYLVYKAIEIGYEPQVILAGRKINNYMPKYVAELTIKALNRAGKILRKSKVLILGLAFKENVSDIRTSKAKEIIDELKEYGVEIIGYDPKVHKKEAENYFEIPIQDNLSFNEIDGIIVFSPHDEFRMLSLKEIKKEMNPLPVLIDIKGMFNHKDAIEEGFIYEQL